VKPLVRTARDADMTFVRACWSRDAYELTRDRPALYTMFRPLFEEIQARILKRATVLVAVNSEDDDQIFGSVVFERASVPVLHHVFVKHALRGNGLGKILLHEAGIRKNKPCVYSMKPVPHSAASRQWTYVPYGLMP
jgi:GNAT superfamily N-acetyltransferase